MTEILFFAGFIVLILGANLLVEGSASLGKKLGIPSIVIGLTIVAFGTSLPELVISGFAASRGETDLAIANVLGSNLLNILIILGITAIITPIPAKKSTTNKVIPGSFIITMILCVSMYFINAGNMAITRLEGIIFLFLFVVFLHLNRRASKNSTEVEENSMMKDLSVTVSVIFIIIGLGALFLSGKWIVNGATSIALKLGISQSVVGLTLVALATSLPELVTSVVAALKKNTDIAIGNVVGSNIFNILLVLGASAVITDLPVYYALKEDLIMVLAATLALFIMLYFGKRKYILQRHEGFILVIIYIVYIIYRL
jgi:cation:H+ antiporter